MFIISCEKCWLRTRGTRTRKWSSVIIAHAQLCTFITDDHFRVRFFFLLMHLSIVSYAPPPPPGGDGGMMGDLSYRFCTLPHIWGIIIGFYLPPHPHPPYREVPITIVALHKSKQILILQLILVNAQCRQMPHLARPMGPGFNNKLPMFAPPMPQVG